MTVYLYRNRLGGFYAENRPLSWQECHCSECGENDYLIGKAGTKEEAWNILEKSGLNRVWYKASVTLYYFPF